MQIKKYIILIQVFLLLFSSCKKETKRIQKLDVWEEILKAVEEKNIDYLIKISEDSLQCVECNNTKDWVPKETFFKKHFDQMKLSRNDKYGYFKEDITKLNSGFDYKIRITYKEKHKGNEYDIIYTILKSNDSIKFLGVFSIP